MKVYVVVDDLSECEYADKAPVIRVCATREKATEILKDWILQTLEEIEIKHDGLEITDERFISESDIDIEKGYACITDYHDARWNEYISIEEHELE